MLASSTDNQHKVRFSDSYTLPEIYSGNTGSGILKAVTSIVSSYAGSEFWKVKLTSGTAFTLYRGEGEDKPDGTGTTDVDFVSTSLIITINSTEWSGTPATGDQFKFRTASVISNDDADEFITDADTIIDGILNKKVDGDNLPLSVIPALIVKASTYLSANLVYSSVFSNLNTDEMPVIVRRWYSFSTKLVDMYLETIAGASFKKYAEYGRFVSREPLFDKIGVEEVAGVLGLPGEKETVNVEYDYDYNSKESVGAT